MTSWAAWAVTNSSACWVRAITAPCVVSGLTFSVGATVGAAMYPRDGHSMASLLAHADQAMREAKAHKLPRRRVAAATHTRAKPA